MNLQLYRNSAPTVPIPIDEQTVYLHEVMGMHEIQTRFTAQSPLDIKTDDYITFRNERYNLNVFTKPKKSSNFEYSYNLVFESYAYWLKERILMHLGAIEFGYFGKARDFVQLIVDCMNEEDTDWAVGTVDDTELKSIDFYGEERGFTCKGGLMRTAEQFGLEFWFTGKTVHMTKQAGFDTNLDFEVGRGKGLYTVTPGRTDTPLYNRIYGFGSTKNLPVDYRNRAERLTFEGRKIERPLAEGERRRETSIIFDDIFPTRTGALTAVSADWLKLTDTSIDFDLNGQRIGSEHVKISFVSGALSGKDYDILNYNHQTKTMTIEPLEEKNGYITPRDTRFPEVGDQYKLIELSLPQTYIDVAESKVKEETQKAFNQLARPPYQIEIDEKYMRDNGIFLNAGDRVRLKDATLGIDDLIRVTSVSFPLVNPNQVTAVVSDSIIYTNEVQQVIDTNKVKENIVVVDRTKSELARRNTLQTRMLQTRIFDTEGDHFDMDNIKPLSIETAMLSVGAKSQNFGLNGVTINANTGGDPNHLSLSSGALVHYEVEIEGLGYIWQIQAADFPDIDPLKSYYLSAKVRDYALDGVWYLSETPMEAESENGYWHFNIGILYPVMNGSRGFDFTKGMTFIVGDRIKSGILESLDGLNFFDLSQGKFKLGDEVSGIDWNITHENVLTIFGAVASSTVIVGSGGFVSAGLSGLADNGDHSVRFWAGADLLNKETANFRVLNNGDAYVRRLIMGYGGSSQGWVVSSTGIISDPPAPTPSNPNPINFALIRGSSYKSEFSFGTNLVPATAGDSLSLTGRIINKQKEASGNPFDPRKNTALQLEASGADENVALDIKAGDIKVLGQSGLSITESVNVWNGSSWTGRSHKYVNGILVSVAWD